MSRTKEVRRMHAHNILDWSWSGELRVMALCMIAGSRRGKGQTPRGYMASLEEQALISGIKTSQLPGIPAEDSECIQVAKISSKKNVT